MKGWTETCRGTVFPWECDMSEHLTVACYYDRFADASLTLMERLGIGPRYMHEQRQGCATVACDTRYMREFRAGDLLHIESAVLAAEGKRLRIGHRVYDSVTGELCTEMRQLLIHMHMDERRALPLPEDIRRRLAGQAVAWDGTQWDDHPPARDDSGFADTLLNTTRPWEIDVVGHLGFQFYVQRFSAAGMQLFGRLGLTPAWLRERRRGYSTFDYRLRFRRELNAGSIVQVRSAVAHLGGSSIRILHRLSDAISGTVSAELDQFGVLLDLDARRPARIPAEIRERAQPLLAKL
ncbi:MAG TPA: thioesterase family protein [Alphaproteobacteria bacterium]|nr:thioesterase family protein [Alphaproteobacteria bacterium]